MYLIRNIKCKFILHFSPLFNVIFWSIPACQQEKSEIGPHSTVDGPQIPRAIETLAFMGKHGFPPSSRFKKTCLGEHLRSRLAKVYTLLPGIIINTTQFVLHTSTGDLLDIDAIIL